MDKKQTNLSPELKEIYDRVMNTSATAKTAAPAAPPPPITPSPALSHTPPPPTPGPSPAAHPAPARPSEITMPSVPDTADGALTSSPPRPVSVVDGTKPFSFSGTASTPKEEAKPGEKKAGISMPILIVLGVAFVAVWGVFWLVILGFINR